MTWIYVMGLISTVALSLPIVMIIATTLMGTEVSPALLIYYAIVLVIIFSQKDILMLILLLSLLGHHQ